MYFHSSVGVVCRILNFVLIFCLVVLWVASMHVVCLYSMVGFTLFFLGLFWFWIWFGALIINIRLMVRVMIISSDVECEAIWLA